MESIERISTIDKSRLSGEHYFQSLLEQAYVLGMLSDTDLKNVQFGCLSVLARQTEGYNGGKSSSIRVENAENILTSIMFTIGVWLKTFRCPDDAVVVIKNEKIEDLYQNGLKRIDTMIKSTKGLHAAILRNLIDSENVFYRSTVVDAIKGFFKVYYPEFGAHEIHITADYPVYNKVEKLAGIEFIQKYLENIYFENLFCSNFKAEDIHHLLCGYDEHYQNLLFNIYEPVLCAAIGCVLAGTDIKRLEITPTAISLFNRLFARKNKKEILGILLEAADGLKQSISLSDNLEGYIKNSLPSIAALIENVAKTNTLDRIFIALKYPENNPKIYFSYGDKMDDELYRKVINEIIKCTRFADKIDVIKEYVHSLADLEDILLDAELCQNEITHILKELSPAEVAALLKKYTSQNGIDITEARENDKNVVV